MIHAYAAFEPGGALQPFEYDPGPLGVGEVGIGGLGHLALKFLNAWGCEVTAFTASESKRDEALRLGAHETLDSRDTRAGGRRWSLRPDPLDGQREAGLERLPGHPETPGAGCTSSAPRWSRSTSPCSRCSRDSKASPPRRSAAPRPPAGCSSSPSDTASRRRRNTSRSNASTTPSPACAAVRPAIGSSSTAARPPVIRLPPEWPTPWHSGTGCEFLPAASL